jgi:hypothetical protein
MNAGLGALFAAKKAAVSGSRDPQTWGLSKQVMQKERASASTCCYSVFSRADDEFDAEEGRYNSNSELCTATYALSAFAGHERYRDNEDDEQPELEQFMQFSLQDKHADVVAVMKALERANADAYFDVAESPLSSEHLPRHLMHHVAEETFGLSDRILLTQADRSVAHVVEHKNEPGFPGVLFRPEHVPELPEPLDANADAAARAAAEKDAVKLEAFLNKFHYDCRSGDGVGRSLVIIQTSGHASEVVFLHPLDPYAPIYVLKLNTGDAYAMYGTGEDVRGVITDGVAREMYRTATQYTPVGKLDPLAEACRGIGCQHPQCRTSLTLRIGLSLPAHNDAWWTKYEGSEALEAKAAAARAVAGR